MLTLLATSDADNICVAIVIAALILSGAVLLAARSIAKAIREARNRE